MDWLSRQLVVIGWGLDGDESGWMQLLVFIVLAVFWAIGGIMKARAASKAQAEKDKKEKGPKAQARPRPSFERLLQTEPQKRPEKPVPVQARKMARQVEREAAELTPAKPVGAEMTEYEYERISPLEIEPPKPVGQMVSPAGTGLAVAEGRPVEIGTAEQLRAAIVHYEIFGKCVALRGLGESVWSR